MRVLLLVCSVTVGGFALTTSPTIPMTFGNGIPSFPICNAPTTVLNYSLSANSSYGLMSHFWVTGGSDIDSIIVE